MQYSPTALGVHWTAAASGGTGKYTYSWSVYGDVANYGEGSTASNSFIDIYSSSGSKSAIVHIGDGTSNILADCSVNVTAPTVTNQPLVVSNASASVASQILDQNNVPVRYAINYTFTLTNNNSVAMYVPSNVSAFVGYSTSPTNASSTIDMLNPVTPVAGDTPTTYMIPSGGGSRTFSIFGTIKKSSNQSVGESLGITSINYGTNQSTGTGSSITTGLQSLFKTVQANANSGSNMASVWDAIRSLFGF